jgi:hypothetical protein
VGNHLVSWAIDETGMIDLSLILNGTGANKQVALVELQERGRTQEMGILDESLKEHGVAPVSKGKGFIQLIYDNVNGTRNRLGNNEKGKNAKEIHDKLEVNIAAYCEY